MRCAWPVFAGLVACGFSPHGAAVDAGRGDATPDSAVDAAIDAVAIDAGSACFGSAAGLIQVCLPKPPIGLKEFTNQEVLDTNLQATCPTTSVQLDGTVVCVIGVGSLIVDAAANVRVFGDRPVVYVVDGDVTIGGTIDVGSHRNDLAGSDGAGADYQSCAVGSAGANDSGGGGGAGGTFGSVGGDGGTGNLGAGSVGDAGSASARVALTTVRGGCPGGIGGAGTAVLGSASGPGKSGGAFYVIATGSIDVGSNGAIFANGQGGGFGAFSAGGAGGGTGGLIGFDAPTVTIDGVLAANGGGGGQGGDDDVAGAAGDPGVDGQAVPAQAAGGAGTGGGIAGFGGSGAGGGSAATDGSDSGAGGGGGGGGVGVIFSVTTVGGSGAESPLVSGPP